MTIRKFALGAGFLTLIASVVLAVLSSVHGHLAGQTDPLAAFHFPAPSGWRSMETPLGPTELAAGEAARTLHFNSYVYRTFQHGALSVRLYAAYWAPARIDPVLVVAHIPDNCWLGNGGKMVAADDDRILPAEGQRACAPAYFRTFLFPTAQEEVTYWYLRGGVRVPLVDPANATASGRLHLFLNMLGATKLGLSAKDQALVRISTNGTIAEVVHGDLWPSLLNALRSAGIAPPSD